TSILQLSPRLKMSWPDAYRAAPLLRDGFRRHRHRAGVWTDPEVLEQFRFLEPMTASILSNGRRVPAFGLAGGVPGALGINRIERTDGRTNALTGAAQRLVVRRSSRRSYPKRRLRGRPGAGPGPSRARLRRHTTSVRA
ncbi:MAG: hydantoinase B/oxoprolinase family protein, partial [Betaproteobacteria bacterium]